jgi:hypothetical protein
MSTMHMGEIYSLVHDEIWSYRKEANMAVQETFYGDNPIRMTQFVRH